MSEPITTRLRCDRCGSHATHERVMGMPSAEAAEEVAAMPGQRLGGCLIVSGMWTVECLTCGQCDEVKGGPADLTPVSAPDRTVAQAITQYAAHCREQLDQAIAPVVSHAGLWLLLASVAEHVTGDDRAALERMLRMSADEASASARRLLAEPHPTLAAAVGVWATHDVTTPVPSPGPDGARRLSLAAHPQPDRLLPAAGRRADPGRRVRPRSPEGATFAGVAGRRRSRRHARRRGALAR